jgi:hypothetical protein
MMSTEDEKFRSLLENGSEEDLVEYFQTHLSHTESGNIPNNVRREIIKGVLDYKNATKMIKLTRRISLLTIVLCILTFVLIIQTTILSWPQLVKLLEFFKNF